jgi:RNA polymerase sigma factor (sigma-70 family)
VAGARGGWTDRPVPEGLDPSTRAEGGRTDEATLVAAAQAGDAQALDELVAAYLPLVYTIVGRALGGLPDVDDVVQETMLRVLRDLRTLRSPDSFRPWLVTIATRQVSSYLRQRHAVERTTALDELVDAEEADAEGFVLLRVELSGQRRQLVRATHWLDPDDRALLSLWWLETAGWLTRTELAVALGLSTAHAGVRVQRMRNQLELSRSLVAALRTRPRCAQLTAALTGWDGVPSPLWRKRIARHTRSCPVCLRAAEGLVPPERLLAGLALLPVPVAVSIAVLGHSAPPGLAAGASSIGALSGASGSIGVDAGIKAGLLSQLAQMVGSHPVATAVMAGTFAAGAAVSTATWSTSAPPAREAFMAPTSAAAVVPPAPRSGATTPASPAAVAAPPTRGRGPTATPPSDPGTRPLWLGLASFESVNEVGRVITAAGDLGVLERIDPDDDDARSRATFAVIRGLADGGCISFRTQDGRYLRHASWRLRLSGDEGTELFRADATFCVRPGLVSGSVSLESANYPGAFLRHRGTQLWVDPSDGSSAFRADASFRPRPALIG